MNYTPLWQILPENGRTRQFFHAFSSLSGGSLLSLLSTVNVIYSDVSPRGW